MEFLSSYLLSSGRVSPHSVSLSLLTYFMTSFYILGIPSLWLLCSPSTVAGWGGWADFLLRADWVLSVPKIPCPALCDFGLYQRGVPTSMLFQDGLWLRPWEPSCKQGVWCPVPEGENQARSQLSSRSKRQRSHLFFPFTF